jgi:hypothetical protein
MTLITINIEATHPPVNKSLNDIFFKDMPVFIMKKIFSMKFVV